MTSPIIPQPKKFVSKFSLSLLIVVISFVSMEGSAAHPHHHPPPKKDLAAICRDQVSHTSAYHEGERKCFVVGTHGMNWKEALLACRELPRLPHFGPPTLATINLNRYEMNDFLRNTMKLDKCVYVWTGGHNLWNGEWRWVADETSFSRSHPAWHPGYPRWSNHFDDCASFSYKAEWFGLNNYESCNKDWPMLCHYKYEAEDRVGGCHLPPLPKNAHLSTKYQMVLPEGKVVVVRCNHGHVVKGAEHRKIQTMLCVNGTWTPTQDCI